MKFTVAQLGARRHYAVPRMLHEAGMLAHLYTDICAVKGWPRLLALTPQSLMPTGLKRLAGRVPVGVPRAKILAATGLGWKYAQCRRRARTPGEVTQTDLWMGRAFCERIIANGVPEVGAVYTFNSAGLELLQYARQQGSRTLMEQTIAPILVQQRLLYEESARFPEWESPIGFDSANAQRSERERAEWKAADTILCGSPFVMQGIAECGGPAERCVVVPYGVDARFAVVNRQERNGPLRVLTVGAVGLRKGSPCVLEAAKRMKGRATFRMVGSVGVLPAAEQELRRYVDLTGPVPRSEILLHYAWADVFLLPSICEGSATVTYEALAAGLPVICTPNTGSVVRDGIEGFMVPIRNAEIVVERLERLATDRQLLREMSRAALDRAKNHCTLEAYSRRLIEAISLTTLPRATVTT